MSGSSRRRHSKWDHRDPEALSENYFEKDPPGKSREPPSPSRGSHRHKSHRRERIMLSDRVDDSRRPSPGVDEWRYQHPSRSPRNGRGRSYRSRSRSRSRSPAYNYRKEPALTERSKGKSGGSATICRDFIAGRCRKGAHCFFLHQDAEFNNSSRSLRRSPPGSWENKDRRIGGSRYSADDNKEYSVRSDKSGNICSDFLKGRCRRGSSCRFAHHEGPGDDRDNNRQIQGDYPDRNHDLENYRRVVTTCKFFAVGNCRNGNHCKFSHQVEGNFSPERRSRDDRRGSDRKLDGSPGSWDHGRVEMKQTWDAQLGTDEPKAGDVEISPRDVSKQHNSGLYSETPSLSNISFPIVPLDTTSETPHDNHYHHDFPERNPSFEDKLNVYAEGGKNDVGGDRMCVTPNPPMNVPPVQGVVQNDSPVNVRPTLSINTAPDQLRFPLLPGGGDTMQLSPLSPSMNAPVGRGISPGDPRIKPRMNPRVQHNTMQLPLHSSSENGMQTSHDHSSLFDNNKAVDGPPGDQSVNFQPLSSINPSASQGRLSLPLHSGGNGMQTSHNPTPFLNNKADNGPHLDNANVTQPVPNHSSVSNEQLAHLSLTLAQLLEKQQQLNLSSASNPSGISNLPSIPSVSNVTIQPSQAPEAVKQYAPICDTTEQRMPKSGNQMVSNTAELKSSDNELCIGNNQQEPYKMSKDGENGGEIVEGGSKDLENKLSENMETNGGDEDGKKPKDSKGLRSFKFALADYTKELLKPAWKDGKVNKETYKTIVKKVVDKVIETQGPQIPQTKEKIDQYLSCSKAKLEKLVQAYVGKYKT